MDISEESFPKFRYFPDPIAAGSVVKSDVICICCNKSRGFIYKHRPCAQGNYRAKICPWCIADGSAAEFIGGKFSTEIGLGGEREQWDSVPEAVSVEVTRRTPGFPTLQNDQWYTHCGDAAEFLGIVTKQALEARGGQAFIDFRESLSDEASEYGLESNSDLIDMIDEGGDGQGYLFRCLHCGKYGGFVDFT